MNKLPSKQILVVTQNVSSTLTQLFVSVLRANVPLTSIASPRLPRAQWYERETGAMGREQ